jgi:hypothetical protein
MPQLEFHRDAFYQYFEVPAAVHPDQHAGTQVPSHAGDYNLGSESALLEEITLARLIGLPYQISGPELQYCASRG